MTARDHSQPYPLIPKPLPSRYVEPEYDGVEMFFHARALYSRGGEAVVAPAGRGAIAAGAWPNRRGEWQQVESSITLNTAASMFYWFVGYPIKSSRGSVYATGLEMHQLGTATC